MIIAEKCTKSLGEGAGERLAGLKNIKILGEIPLNMDIREGADTGNPVALTATETPQSLAYMQLKDEIISLI